MLPGEVGFGVSWLLARTCGPHLPKCFTGDIYFRTAEEGRARERECRDRRWEVGEVFIGQEVADQRNFGCGDSLAYAVVLSKANRLSFYFLLS